MKRLIFLISFATLAATLAAAPQNSPVGGSRGSDTDPGVGTRRGHAPDKRASRSLRRTPIVRAVEKSLPAVVDIQTKRLARRSRRHPLDAFFEFGGDQRNRSSQGSRSLRDHSLGSGVIIDPEGYVVTNDHVIRQADKIEIRLSDGRHFEARLIGKDSDNDLAILKIQSPGPFPTVPLAESNDIMLGETAIAMGNPFGLEGSVTTGIVSAKNRSVEFRGKRLFEDFLQTSAVINPGNSGGPLLNLNGELMGINVAIHSRGPGIGFAIPVGRVREVIYRLLDPRVLREFWVGLDLEHEKEIPGARIRAVEAKSPAARSGLRAGDVVTHMNGRRIRNWIDLQARIDEANVGVSFRLDLRRRGSAKPIHAFLKLEPAPPSRSDRAAFAMIGFEFRTMTAKEVQGSGLEGGVVVSRVSPGSAAESIGLQVGDRIYQLAGYSIKNRRQALAAISSVERSRRRALRISLHRPTSNDHLSGTILMDKKAAIR